MGQGGTARCGGLEDEIGGERDQHSIGMQEVIFASRRKSVLYTDHFDMLTSKSLALTYESRAN